MYNGSQVYYTFPAFDNGSRINQPVLLYGSATLGVNGQNVTIGGPYWSIIAVHCVDNSLYGCVIGSEPTVQTGDVIHGTVTTYNCSPGYCDFDIVVQDVTTPTARSEIAAIHDADNYTVLGGAVETYGFSSCNQYPVNGVFFSQITVDDQNGAQVYPAWKTIVRPVTPSCSFSVYQVDAMNVKLYHNPAPGGSITSYITNPSPPLLYQPFTLTLNGTGWNPATVEIDFTQNCFPPNNVSCPLSIYGANSRLSPKTSTQLGAGNVFGTPGTLYITTRNGDGGTLSNWIQITLPQR